MRKQGYSDELIEQSNAHNETDDTEILEARETFNKYNEKFEKEIKEEKEKVIAAGGLKIIGTERHESRRIDNQLRGRSGRQGDPGESRFYIALDDDLMKIFGGDMITSVYNTLKADENMPIEMGMISKAVENAQKRVEGRHFSIRKHVLQYDDVMNTQREIIYKQRKEVLDGENLKDQIQKMMHSVVEEVVTTHETEEGVDKEGLRTEAKAILNIELEDINNNPQELIEEISNKVIESYDAKEKEIGEKELRELERVVMLKVVDQKWMDHIDSMDELKDGIGLRAYGQKDPVALYKIEGFDMFEQMTNDIKIDVVKILTHIKGIQNTERKQTVKITGEGLKQEGTPTIPNKSQNAPNTPIKNQGPQVGRNDPCPCGSGKKYKNCCGK
jgi:preprotein translocase subunit SecA